MLLQLIKYYRTGEDKPLLPEQAAMDSAFSFKNNGEISVAKFENIKNLVPDDLTTKSNIYTAPFIWADNNEDIKVQNCSSINKIDIFLRAENNKHIFLINNYLSSAKYNVFLYEHKKDDKFYKD